MGPLPPPRENAAADAASTTAVNPTALRGGVSRPWDRPGGLRNVKRAKKTTFGGRGSDGTSTEVSRASSTTSSVPSIVVDGVEFYSDRFYLTSTEYDNLHEPQLGADAAQSPDNGTCRHCGESLTSTNESVVTRTPSLDCRSDVLDVSRLVASLDLKAALLATFSIDTNWFLEEFPSLTGHVPTLVLHGQRGSTDADGSSATGNNDEGNKRTGTDQPHRGNLSAPSNANDDDDDAAVDDCSVDSWNSEELYTQPEETLAYVRAMMMEAKDSSIACGSKNSPQDKFEISPDLHFTKVITKWVPPATGTGRQAGEFKAGVHHPKFLLLFERSGSLVVVVTTANLTPRRTIDGAWVQRFFHNSSPQTRTASTAAADSTTTSDFGRVLQNLLTAQTHAIQIHTKNREEVPMTPHAFCRKHLGWDNLDPLSSAFDYSTAQVHLVATIPGSYRTPDYGRQRVSHILQQISSQLSHERRPGTTVSDRPWLPPELLTDRDRVVIQPTSFGEWSEGKLQDVLQSYLRESEQASRINLGRLDIVWPSEKFVQSVRSNLKSLRSKMTTLLPLQDSTLQQLHCRTQRMDIETKAKSHVSVSVEEPEVDQNRPNQTSSVPRPLGIPHERRTRGGYMFLSSTIFNKIETSCLSRMVQWEPCHPVPLSKRPVLVSHLKTISRVVGRSRSHQPWSRSPSGDVDEVLSWVLMTSACLSRGAQGESLDRNSTSNSEETVSYANFELGVLFCSRLQHMPTDRVYCWRKSGCTCHVKTEETSTAARSGDSRPGPRIANGPRMIALPFPFRFDAARYQSVDDELEFAETPYFHEITPSDCHVGNMRMTPFGEYVAHKLDDE